jgi:hypothetical protein
MKRLLIMMLAFGVTSCAAPAQPTLVASSTPVIVVQTVLVTVVPTEKSTELPTFTTVPPSAPTLDLTASTSPTASETLPAASTTLTATLPANAGGDLFTNLTRSTDRFALRCQPDMITFGVSTSNVYVTGVDLYYRIEDRLGVGISQWNWGGSMVSDKRGNFTLDFPSSWVDKDLRSHRAWFDYQFVGLNKSGDALGRSAKIVRQITFAIDCSD